MERFHSDVAVRPFNIDIATSDSAFKNRASLRKGRRRVTPHHQMV
jgi:hypothetical protein